MIIIDEDGNLTARQVAKVRRRARCARCALLGPAGPCRALLGRAAVAKLSPSTTLAGTRPSSRPLSASCPTSPPLPQPEKLTPCIFEYIYLARPGESSGPALEGGAARAGRRQRSGRRRRRPSLALPSASLLPSSTSPSPLADSVLNEIPVYNFQLGLGTRLAARIKQRGWDVDLVCPVPDGSRPAAIQVRGRGPWVGGLLWGQETHVRLERAAAAAAWQGQQRRAQPRQRPTVPPSPSKPSPNRSRRSWACRTARAW